MASEIKLQALKENVESVEVNSVKVNPGDVVAKEQPLLEVQADKAALDVPSPVAGRVAKVLVKAGDQIKIGQVYCLIDVTGGDTGNGAAAASAAEARPAKAAAAGDKKEPPKEDRRPAATAVATAPLAVPSAAVAVQSPPADDSQPSAAAVVAAGPATRRLARELGIDLSLVHGSGRGGRVVEDDVKAFVRRLATGGTTAVSPSSVAPPLPNFESFGPVERQELTRVRKITARQMSLAWNTIPHVTQHDLADVTDLEAFRKSQDGKGPKLTVTAFALKACAVALKLFPTFNASLDLANNKLVFKRYYHVGVAVDTEGGLLVPVIRDVDKKSVSRLAQELNETAEKARQGKADMSGGTFTITNLGGIGGTGFTPIVNWPEVAILGMSRSRLEPTVRNGTVVPRLMLPLSLSYDHRVIDGAAAARFTRRVAEMLENPLLMLL
jgi:pyruvate dehydrogenase E2 component (dihydrolipoamide acetyltransferase)